MYIAMLFMIAKTFAPFRGVKPFAITEWGAGAGTASTPGRDTAQR
jgi:hypothetical protein